MYNKIMVPLDGSELAECVLPHVETFIAGCQVQSIVLVRVVEPVTQIIGAEYAVNLEELQERESTRISEAKAYLENVVKRLEKNSVQIRTEVIEGRVADSLADYADKHQFDLILIATHGRSGVSRWVWGSVADRILHAATIPILMVRASRSVK